MTSTLRLFAQRTFSRVAIGSLKIGSPPQQCGGVLSQLPIRFFGTVKEEVPEEDYYDGHLMADHLEYLNDMIEKTEMMEETMKDLQETYGKKKKLHTTIKWTDTDEIDYLFERAAKQKQDLREQLAELRAVMKEAKSAYAVDAPDGQSDIRAKEEMEEVKRLIDDAAEIENPAEIEKMHEKQELEAKEAKKTFAVDSPDGLGDDLQLEELDEVKHIIDDAAEVEDFDKIEALHHRQEEAAREAKKTFAVDSPDGLADDEKKAELEEVQHIIDDAAEVEDKEEIEELHKKEEAVRKDRARDPEHDW